VRKYFIKIGQEPEQEVTKQQYVDYEKRCGFRLDNNSNPATSGFTFKTQNQFITGRVVLK